MVFDGGDVWQVPSTTSRATQRPHTSCNSQCNKQLAAATPRCQTARRRTEVRRWLEDGGCCRVPNLCALRNFAVSARPGERATRAAPSKQRSRKCACVAPVLNLLRDDVSHELRHREQCHDEIAGPTNRNRGHI